MLTLAINTSAYAAEQGDLEWNAVRGRGVGWGARSRPACAQWHGGCSGTAQQLPRPLEHAAVGRLAAHCCQELLVPPSPAAMARFLQCMGFVDSPAGMLGLGFSYHATMLHSRQLATLASS